MNINDTRKTHDDRKRRFRESENNERKARKPGPNVLKGGGEDEALPRGTPTSESLDASQSPGCGSRPPPRSTGSARQKAANTNATYTRHDGEKETDWQRQRVGSLCLQKRKKLTVPKFQLTSTILRQLYPYRAHC